jgi:hypothetical protein
MHVTPPYEQLAADHGNLRWLLRYTVGKNKNVGGVSRC